MLKDLKDDILTRFPSLGIYKRYFSALLDSCLSTKTTYSQHAEDKYLSVCLNNYDLTDAIYIDIGSNHPTSISNTYLFYRMGLHGVAIEPNSELTRLHRIFRPNDIILGIGCGNQSTLGRFEVGKAPVLSHFYSNEIRSQASEKLGFKHWRTEYIPILPVDSILTEIKHDWIFFLSVDVEGLDFEVLQGAKQTLKKVLFICVEANNESEAKKIEYFLAEQGFVLKHEIQCNMLFLNKSNRFEQYKKVAVQPDLLAI